MATYAIGDLQGCFDPLQELLGETGFREAEDRLWFVGDLVNRGPQSLEILRFVEGLGERAVSVLGNHDLHLLMVAEGRAEAHRKDTLGAILDAPDRDELLTWLRGLPLMHADGEYTMVHAGLLPSWSVRKALDLAREAEHALQGSDWRWIRVACGDGVSAQCAWRTGGYIRFPVRNWQIERGRDRGLRLRGKLAARFPHGVDGRQENQRGANRLLGKNQPQRLR